MRWKPLASAALAALLLTGQTYAAGPDGQGWPQKRGRALPEDSTLTLGAVVEAALARAPDTLSITARRDEADALNRRAGSFIAGNPALLLRYQSDAVGDDLGYTETEGGLELPLWRWGERSAAGDLADRTLEYAGLSGDALALAVAGDVRESLWFLSIAENRLRLARRELDTAQSLEDRVRKRLAGGDVPRTDLLLARDETLQRESAWRQAQVELLHAREQYVRLTGLERRPADFTETPVAEADTTSNPRLAEAQGAVNRALAEQEWVRQSASGSPSVAFTALSQEDPSGLTVESLNVSLSLPLPWSSQNAPARARAARAVAEAQADLARRGREQAMAIEHARHAMEGARDSLEVANARRELTAESLRLASRAYELGESSLTDLLRVQARAFTAEREAVLRQLELNRAIARYNQAQGVTP